MWKHGDSNGLYPQQIEQILDIGHPLWTFDQLICYDYDQPFSILSWIKRINTCNGIHGLSEDKMDTFNRELERILTEYFRRKYGQIPRTFMVKHRIWTLVAKFSDDTQRSML